MSLRTRPAGPWIIRQRWCDLLFAHWPVAPDVLGGLIPDSLEIDLLDGQAWIAVVPFRMEGIRARLLPPVPGMSAFAELNVRTYVQPRGGGEPGVYFLSLEASNPVAVQAARRFFHLPYMDAEMSCRRDDGWLRYRSARTHRDEPPAEFHGRYRALGRARPTRLTHWLTERYCLYATDCCGGLYQCHVDHDPWPLEDAEAQIEINTMAASAGIHLPSQPPLLHFSPAVDVRIWPLRRIG